MRSVEQMMAGWGRYPRLECRVASPRSADDVRVLLDEGPLIARGLGRSYGDSALNEGMTLDMTSLNRFLDFRPDTGILTAEAGVVLGDIIQAFLPRGWFPTVTPGTKFVTVGGMIAADVHGKNHHKEGSFGGSVLWLDLLGPDGRVRRCSLSENGDLFGWTKGGMGLTGVILRASFGLRRVDTAWIHQRLVPEPNLKAVMEAFEAEMAVDYSVAWIDCLAKGQKLGRSLLMLGEHATVDDLDPKRRKAPFSTPTKRTVQVPFDAPSFALNSLTVGAFNALYNWMGKRSAGESIVDWDSYFYPLDRILGWNRVYGRRGLAQFQCVLPMDSAESGLRSLLEATSSAGEGSFLAVLKRFGPQESMFSFPTDGYTLAMDFPVDKASLRLLDELDRIALDHGGHFYLAKDARMTRDTLDQSDPRASAFRDMRDHGTLRQAFASVQSRRLEL